MQFSTIAFALAVVGLVGANDIFERQEPSSSALSSSASSSASLSLSSEAPVLTAQRIFWQSIEAEPFLELVTETVTWTQYPEPVSTTV